MNTPNISNVRKLRRDMERREKMMEQGIDPDADDDEDGDQQTATTAESSAI